MCLPSKGVMLNGPTVPDKKVHVLYLRNVYKTIRSMGVVLLYSRNRHRINDKKMEEKWNIVNSSNTETKRFVVCGHVLRTNSPTSSKSASTSW